MAIENPYREDPWQHLIKVSSRVVFVSGATVNIGSVTGMTFDYLFNGIGVFSAWQAFSITPPPAAIEVVGVPSPRIEGDPPIQPPSGIAFAVLKYTGDISIEELFSTASGLNPEFPDGSLEDVASAHISMLSAGGIARITFDSNGGVISTFTTNTGLQIFDPPL